MKDFRVSNKGTVQLFSNPVLERMTRTPFAFPVTFFFLLAVAVSIYYTENYYTSPVVMVLYFIAGMLAFTLVEYLMHRFVYHFPAKNERQKEIQYSIHGVHHEYPKDKDRLVMPPIISMTLAIVFFFLFSFILGHSGLVFFSGFSVGYSTYLIIHYAVHKLRPPKNFLRYWWKHHSLHHYHSVDSAFSVSFPLWDVLFGTMPAKVSRSDQGKMLERLMTEHHSE
jgi:4-hydroxysphinganine ceramide fatty acyl 2-hydroxylase